MPEFSKDAAPRGEGVGDVTLTVVRPDTRPRGSIVLLHRSQEFSPVLRDFMGALADERWLVVAPDLHSRFGQEGATGTFGDALYEDIDATSRWIATHGIAGDTVGILGFDDAGAAAVYVAVERTVGAVVSVASPGIVRSVNSDAPALVDVVGSLRSPWLGLYGDDDPNTPPDDIASLREAAGRSDAPTLVVSYAGLAHRPDEPPVVRESVDPDTDAGEAAIIDARRRIFDWFDSHLR